MSGTATAQTSKRTRDADKSRAIILQAALDEFAERGFQGATIRAIAARTDLSHSIIRYHYKSKEKLWMAAVDFLFERATEELKLSDEDVAKLISGDLDVYRDLLRKAVRYSARHPEHTRIVMQESILRSSRLKYYTETHLPDYLDRFEGLVMVLKELGVIPQHISTISYHYMLTGAANTLFATAEEAEAMFGVSPMTDDVIEGHCEAVVALFCPKK